MAVYDIHTLPVGIKDLRRRKKEGEEFILKDPKIDGPSIPVLFDEIEEEDVDDRTRLYIPMACILPPDYDPDLPEKAIVVPFDLLRQVTGDYVTEDVIRFMIAHEYGHFVLNSGFADPGRSGQFLELIKFLLFAEPTQAEMDADHYAIRAIAPYLKNDEEVKKLYAKALNWMDLAYDKGSISRIERRASIRMLEKRRTRVIDRFYAEYREAQKRNQKR